MIRRCDTDRAESPQALPKTADIALLALDVDGTLVRPDQTVAPEVVRAVQNARSRGVRVCLATGRSLIETLPVWEQLGIEASQHTEPMVTLGGALVAEPHTHRTLWHRPIAPATATACVEAFRAAGRSAMGIVDRWRWGMDYLFLPGDDHGEAHTKWLAKMPDVVVRQVEDLDDGPDILRINCIVEPHEAEVLEARLRERLGKSMTLHAIYAPNYNVTVVEAFHPEANKWTALRYVAQGLGIGRSRIAAVGDDVNDLPMLRGAGLGVAMPGASQAVRDAADLVASEGLAGCIDSLSPE